MSGTKADIVNDAYSQLRISGLTVDPTPEDMMVALGRLDNMMAELSSRNICTRYNIEDTPDPSSVTNVDQSFWHMMATNLAVRLIPDFNKQVPPTLMAQASQSLQNASARSAADSVRETRYPHRMPRGNANTLRFNRWQRFYREEARAPIDCATNTIVMGDVNDYQEGFAAYLNMGETVASFVISADPGIIVVSSSLTSPTVSYRIRAEDNSTEGPWQQVKIDATTSAGRITTRLINFDVRDNQTVGSQ